MALHVIFLLAMQAFYTRADPGNAIKALNKRAEPAACDAWADVISFCKSVSPGFVSLPATKQVPCLCYDTDGEWIPDVFDGLVDTCAAWAVTADVADFTVVDSWQGICTDVGNIFAAPHSTPALNTPTPTPSPTRSSVSAAAATTTSAPILKQSGCSAFSSLVSSCTQATPGILDMTYGAIAACLCYTSSTSWIPTRFDGAAASCANVVKTGDPTGYVAFTSDFLNLCTEVGDVVNTPDSPLKTPPVTTTTQRTTAQSTPKVTPIPTTVVLGSSPSASVTTKSSNALQVLAGEGSMWVLVSSWLIFTILFAIM
jgi:hypothetical protein